MLAVEHSRMTLPQWPFLAQRARPLHRERRPRGAGRSFHPYALRLVFRAANGADAVGFRPNSREYGMSRTPGEGIPPLVGLDLLIVSSGSDRAQPRIRPLEEFGYRVAVCGELPLLAKAIARRPPGAIIVDLVHEVANAPDLVRRIRGLTNVPVLVVGCAGTSSEMLRCFDAGA